MNPSPPRWTAGDLILSRYEVAQVRSGGFAHVFVARDVEEGVLVAAKALRDDLIESEEQRHRFEEEARLWIELPDHPNLVGAQYVLWDGGKPLIFLDFVPGSLRAWLAAGSYSPEDALRTTLGICHGLQAARRAHHGIVHLDLKPENVLLDTEGTPKIADWGIARLVGQAGGGVGTPGYMAPEQSVPGSAVTESADVYALGMMLREILLGVAPSSALDPEAAPSADTTAHAALSTGSTAIDGVEELLTRCLHEDPSARPVLDELISALSDLHEEVVGEPYKPAAMSSDSAWKEHNNRGASYESLGLYDEALEALNQALALKPDSIEALINKGIVCERLGRPDEAVRCYDRATEIDPNAALAWNNRGNALASLERHDAAIESYRRAVEIDPEYDRAWNNLGWAIRSYASDAEEAMRCFRRACDLNPRSEDAYNHLGVGLMDLERYEEAEDALNAAIRLNPRSAKAYLNRANARYKLDRFEESLADAQRSVELETTVEGLNGQAIALQGLGRHDDALGVLDAALEVDHSYFATHYHRGTSLLEVGREADAVEATRTALALNPDHAASHDLVGFYLNQSGRTVEALNHHDEAVRLEPETDHFHYNRGVAQAASGDRASAIESYREAVRLNPAYVEAHTNLGGSLHRLGEYAEAVQAYQAALAHDPEHPIAWHNFGLALAKLGQTDRAAECHRRALEIAPDYTSALYNLGSLLMDQGDAATARACFERALSADPKHLDSLNAMGALAFNSGDVEGARAYFETMLQIDPSSEMARANLQAVSAVRAPEAQGSRAEVDPAAIEEIAILTPVGQPFPEEGFESIAMALYEEINPDLGQRMAEDGRWVGMALCRAQSAPHPEHGMIGAAEAFARQLMDGQRTVLVQGAIGMSQAAQEHGLPAEVWILTVLRTPSGSKPQLGFVAEGSLGPASG